MKLVRISFFVLTVFGMLACQVFSPAADPITATPDLPTEIADAKGVSMRLIPAGDFTMGSDGEMAGEAQPAPRRGARRLRDLGTGQFGAARLWP